MGITIIGIFGIFVTFLLGAAIGGYAMLASGLIVLNNIIEPRAEIKTYQSRAICQQREKRDCDMMYIRIYIPKTGKIEEVKNG